MSYKKKRKGRKKRWKRRKRKTVLRGETVTIPLVVSDSTLKYENSGMASAWKAVRVKKVKEGRGKVWREEVKKREGDGETGGGKRKEREGKE